MTERAVTATERLRVFISYARSDSEFADEIVDGLALIGGFDVTIDRHSIGTGDDWQSRIGSLIEEADTVVFVLSPDAVQSKICRWEVEHAAELKKRLVPVLHRPLGAIAAPPELAAINYVDFDSSATLIAGIRVLADTLNTDFDWLREATRLMGLAFDWERSSRRDNRLLSGADIGESKIWLDAKPASMEVTELHRDFIKASEDAEIVRLDDERRKATDFAEAQRLAAVSAKRGRRWAMAGLSVALVLAVVAVGAGVVAYRQQVLAEAGKAQAELAVLEAKQQRDIAQEEKQNAQREQERAKLAISIILAKIEIDQPGYCQSAAQLVPVEFLVCLDDDLSAQDKIMIDLFGELRSQLSKPARDQLRQDQRNWLSQRQKTCDPAGKRLWEPQDVTEARACLLGQLQQRNAQMKEQLEAVRDAN